MMKKISIFIFVTITAFWGSAAEPTSVLAKEFLAEYENLYRGQLDNGMKYIVMPNAQAGKRASIQLIVHSGSLDEAEDQLGIAHLVEHMAFNGTKDFPNNKLIEHAESLGMVFGKDINAMTEQYSTSYYFDLPNNSKDMLNEGFHMLSQQAFAQVFDDEELEKERPVVEEEWRASRGMKARLRNATKEIMLGNTLFAKRDPIGDMALVRNIKASRIKDFWQTWYHPNNMTLIVVGDVSIESVKPLISKYFDSIPAKALPKREKINIDFPSELVVANIADKELNTELITLNLRGFQAPALTKTALKQELLNTLAIAMLSKRLDETYQTEGEFISRMVAREQGLVVEYNNNVILGIIKDKNYLKAYKELFSHLFMFKAYGFTEIDLKVAKADTLQYMQMIAKFYAKPTNTSLLKNLFYPARLNQPLIDPSAKAVEAESILSLITLEEVNQYFQSMIEKRSPVAIIQLSEKNKDALPTSQDVISLWNSIRLNPPKMDKKITEFLPLFTKKLSPVEPIVEQKIDDTWIWHFANGASVWFTPSDKTKETVLLAWQGEGGTQHFPRDKLRTAQIAGSTIPSFGYAGLTEPEVNMANAGKMIQLSPYIGELDHEIIGSATAPQLEAWLQNMYLMMMEPQINDKVWQSQKNILVRKLNRDVITPERQFSEAVDKLRFVNDPAHLPILAEEISPIKAEDMLTAWQTFFSDASGRQLVIVGNTSAENVKKLVSLYVGNLPKGKAKTTAVTPKLWSGQQNLDINAGVEPKGITSWYFNTDYPYSKDAARQAALVSQIVRTRLTKAIRENAGGTYSPSFRITLDRERQQLYGSMSYGHQPKRKDELKLMAFTVLDTLKKEGITLEELNEVKQQQRQYYEKENISDRVRLAWLRNDASENQASKEPEGYLLWLDTIQPAEINALLSFALNSANTIDASLSPAK